jgi:hypothetical protein
MSAQHTAPLPLHQHRCYVTTADAWCRACLRHAREPWQTWGPETPSQIVPSSYDEDCAYIPTPAARAAIQTAESTATQEAA